jgi:glyoxylase-like metal-dependent hydrolase (beta-lactamase superfamily II)
VSIDHIDLLFRGHPGVIAAALVTGPGEVILIDPGPTSCLPRLESGLRDRGLSLRDVRTILLTHIHLDHAGATGTIVERVNGIRVYVHERGAPHLIDPSKLMASAARLYGDQMDTLWGAFLPVPSAQVTAIAGGERLTMAGRSFHVAYTPGHAQHHVCYLDEADGIAYVGDTAGVRVTGDYVLAPTPPPDIDIEAWMASLDAIDAWNPVSLFLTHFGPVSPARAHVALFRRVLSAQASAVKEVMQSGGAEAEQKAAFVERMRRDARASLPEHEARATELAAPFEQLFEGLSRYWTRRDAKQRPPSAAGG